MMRDPLAQRCGHSPSAHRRRQSIAGAALTAAAVAWVGVHALAAQNAPAVAEQSAADVPPTEEAIDKSAATLPEAPEELAPSRASRADKEDGETTFARLREGTQLTDRLGQFRQDGDAISFIDEEGREFGSLPNLSLERIVSALKGVEEPESVWWSVSGTITEFNERNYILVTRAVYKAAALPPTPDRVE
jgi:hypothetical protein